MKVFMLIRSLDAGGAERQFVNVAAGLAERGHQVEAAVYYSGGELQKDLPGSIVFHDLRKKSRYDLAVFGLRLARTIRVSKPDAVYSFLPTSNLLTGLLKPALGGPALIWGIRAADMDLSRYSRLSRLSSDFERRLSSVPDKIVCNSHAGRKHIVAAGFPADKTEVIANGINVKRFSPDRQARAQVRAEWGVGEEEILVGLPARLDPVKNHELFIRAAAKAAKEQNGLRFACIGDGDWSSMQARAKGDGVDQAFIWPGKRTDMPRVYNALDICALTSDSEGFPNAPAEAMAVGIPCVATDVGDVAVILGDTGVLVPARNPEALAQGIIGLARRLPTEKPLLAQAARKRIIESFSIRAMLDATENTLAAAAGHT